MAVTVFDSITAREIIVGSMPAASRPATPMTGTLGMSGAILVYFNGTAWVKSTQ